MIEMSDERLWLLVEHARLFTDYADRTALTSDDVRSLVGELLAMREQCDVHHVAVIWRLTAEVASLREQLAQDRTANPPRGHRIQGGQRP